MEASDWPDGRGDIRRGHRDPRSDVRDRASRLRLVRCEPPRRASARRHRGRPRRGLGRSRSDVVASVLRRGRRELGLRRGERAGPRNRTRSHGGRCSPAPVPVGSGPSMQACSRRTPRASPFTRASASASSAASSASRSSTASGATPSCSSSGSRAADGASYRDREAGAFRDPREQNLRSQILFCGLSPAAEHDTGVVPAETEGVVDTYVDLLRARLVGDVVEIAGGIRDPRS